MEPIAAGFLVMIAAATISGLFIGALGGAVAWRLKLNVFLGLGLTTVAFIAMFAMDRGGLAWLNAELTWGFPPIVFSFLIALIAARGLAALTVLRPNWIALAAFVVALIAAFVYVLLLRPDIGAVPKTTSIVDAVLIVVFLLMRRLRYRDSRRENDNALSKAGPA